LWPAVALNDRSLIMRSPYLRTALLATAALPFAAQAAEPFYIEEIVVTASRTQQSLKTVGSAIDILTEADLQARPSFVLSDVLRDIPGVSVNRSGQIGKLTQVRIRGAEGNHTLVMIDGIEAGDPFNNSEFDFANLLSSGVTRVEVLRGPQSAIYGSEAIGGVINIITTGDEKGPPQFTVEAEGGSFDTYTGSAKVSGGGEGYGYNASVAYLDVGGISQSPTGTEKDGHDNLTLSGNWRAAASELFDFTLAARYTDATTEDDTQDFTFGSPTQGFVIDSDDRRTAKTLYGKAQGRLSLLEGKWDHIVSAAVTDASVRNYSFGAFSFGNNGRKTDLEYQTDLFFGSAETVSHTLTGLVELTDEDYENLSAAPGPSNQERSIQNLGYVAEYRAAFAQGVTLSGAIRHDDNDGFANETTYRGSAAWAIPDTGMKLRASYGTGVAQPNFYELYGFDPTTFVGNPDLTAETSEGWDVGADFSFANDTAYLSATWFDTDLKNEIYTDFAVFPFTARNRTGTSTRQGLELSGRYTPEAPWSLAAAYTYTDAKDDTGAREQRRPKHVASVTASTRFLDDRGRVNLGVDYNGKMDDVEVIFATPEDVVSLDSYTLVNLSGTYDVTETVQVFGRIDNLLDEDYEEVFGYTTTGLGAYAGVRLRFGG